MFSHVPIHYALGGQVSQIHSKFSHHVSLTKYLAQTHQLYGQDRNVSHMIQTGTLVTSC
jgi:hypothetical protein